MDFDYSTPRLKICCIQNLAEVQTALNYGASAVGLVSRMPSGPGVISDDQISQIAQALPPGISSVLLTAATDADKIIAQQHQLKVNTIQLVDRQTAACHIALRASLPGIKLIQVVHITGEEAFEEAMNLSSRVDALLLDSGNPKAAVKELGGTARTHNWTISRRIVEFSSLPVFLAGGLHPGNVAQAIATVHPFGVDVCSGIRRAGFLDKELLQQFADNIRNV